MTPPLVSVAVITYNMEGYLPQLLDSILCQEVSFPYEIVINDDCSPDNSRAIIEAYREKHPEIIHPAYEPQNQGGSKNMYGVMHHCQGKYIAILEGDDWWEDPGKLQYQVDFLEAHPEYIGMCCNSWCDHGVEAEYRDVMRTRTEPKVFTLDDFLTQRHFSGRLPSSTDTWVFRNFWGDGGDYSLFYKAHNMVWDQSLALILLSKGPFYADPKLVSHHRSVVKSDGTNYQSLITQKNIMDQDSRMYQAMEVYITQVLRCSCGPFYLVRGDVWVEAVYRFLLSRKKADWTVARKIGQDQKRKLMLGRLFVAKGMDIAKRKIKRKLKR